jgi:Fantastic Four meristem regulator
MLVICRCLSGSSKGAGGDKLKYYDIPSFPFEGLPLHAPPKEAQPPSDIEAEDGEESEVEPQPEETLAKGSQTDEIEVEPLSSDETIAEKSQLDEEPEETKVEEPQQLAESELQDLGLLFGSREPDPSSLYRCTEILGSESCDNMVQETGDAVTEWSWTHKRQKQKAIEKEMLANRRFPPPIPQYTGKPCQFMKIKRCDGRITMSLVQMDRQPEQLLIERDDGQIKMQLMMYVREDMNDDTEASTSASTLHQVVETSDQEMTSEEDEWESDKRGSNEKRKELAIAA